MKANRIHKTWFKNQIKKGNLLAKRTGRYTDDYAWDAATGFGQQKEFNEITGDLFGDWYIDALFLYGDKNGMINGCFASCEYWEFKVK